MVGPVRQSVLSAAATPYSRSGSQRNVVYADEAEAQTAAAQQLEGARMDLIDTDGKGSDPGSLAAKKSDGAMVVGLPKPIGLGTIELIFNARQFFTMYIFKNFYVKNSNGEQLYCMPLYTFNSGHLDHYLDSQACAALKPFITPHMNLQVVNIKGSLKSIGITAPFVTSSDGQSSTNSQLTAMALVGNGLERRTQLIEGEVTITDNTTDVKFFYNKTNTRRNSTSFSMPLLTVANTPTTIPNTMSSSNMKEYTTISGLVPSGLTVHSNYSKYCKAVDLTESEGPILGWDYEMEDSFLHVNHMSSLWNVAPSWRVSDTEAVSGTGFTDNQINPADDPQDWFITHNNVSRVGQNVPKHQLLPPKHYLQMIQPPTINETLIQNYFVSTCLDTEIVIRGFQSVTGPNYIDKGYQFIPKYDFAGFRQSRYDGQIYGFGLFDLVP